MNSSSIPSVGELRRAGKPALLRQAGAEAAAATRAAFEVRAHNTLATFRIHPFPEGEGNLRRSVREAECVYLQSTLEDFLRWNRGETTNCGAFKPFPRDKFWAYCDYKDTPELFDCGDVDLRTCLPWDHIVAGCAAEGKSGLPDATVWIGTRGAHSALHFDTYGVNVVLQVCGRKRWRLWQPSCSDALRPTRVPYEESSVFANIDPRSSSSQGIPQPDLDVTLEAGDALFVPHHWWHEVECLESTDNEPCISANVWLGADAPLTSSESLHSAHKYDAVPRKRPLEEAISATKSSASSSSSSSSSCTSETTVEREPPKQRQHYERDEGKDVIVCGKGCSSAGGSDALSRVSEAITRVVISALFTAATRTKPQEQSGIANSSSSSRTRGDVDSSPLSSADRDSGYSDARADDVLNQWLNPTEEIMSHGENMEMLQAAVAQFNAELQARQNADESDDNTAGATSRCPDIENEVKLGLGGSETKGSVSLSQLVDALLQPRATHDAAARLCAAIAIDGEPGNT